MKDRQMLNEIYNHHLLCIGVLALCYTEVNDDLKKSIEQGLEEAIGFDIGIPENAVERLKKSLPVMGELH